MNYEQYKNKNTQYYYADNFETDKCRRIIKFKFSKTRKFIIDDLKDLYDVNRISELLIINGLLIVIPNELLSKEYNYDKTLMQKVYEYYTVRSLLSKEVSDKMIFLISELSIKE